MGNPEPVFAAKNIRLMAPPRVMKDKHVKLKLSTENREPGTEDWRRAITFNALGWHMAERMKKSQLLPGDTLDIAFTLDYNDHPEFGGLELSLRDFRAKAGTTEGTEVTAEKASHSVPAQAS